MDHLLMIAGAADKTAVLQTNTERLDESLAYKLRATKVSGVANTLNGPPTSGTWTIDTAWVDKNCSVWRCASAGTPGSWIQDHPAVGAAFPTGTIVDRYLFRRSDLNYDLYYYDLASTTWNKMHPTNGLTGDVFGDGNDGTLTFDGAATILGIVPSGNVYTLTRPIFAATMTVNAGVTIITNGYRIFCSGTLTINSTGIIQWDGAAGTNGTPSSNSTNTGVGAARTSVEVGGSGSGGAGGAGGNTNGNGANGSTPSALSPAMGGAGGNGGAGGTGDSGARAGGGAGTGGAITNRALRALSHHLLSGASIIVAGNAGGGGGGGGGSSSGIAATGGAAGSGGGVVFIFAKTIANSGTIRATGGAGGNGGNASITNCGGGGGAGGGGGGVVYLCYNTLTNSGTIAAAGGAAGTGGTGNGTGATGGNGVAGSAGLVMKFNGTTRAWE